MDPKIIMCKLQGPDSQGNGGGHEPCQFNEKVDHNEVLSLPDTPSLKSVIASWGGPYLQQPRENTNKSKFVVAKLYKAKSV
jgi:hypothetical protein